jgi:hypothetical protein
VMSVLIRHQINEKFSRRLTVDRVFRNILIMLIHGIIIHFSFQVVLFSLEYAMPLPHAV